MKSSQRHAASHRRFLPRNQDRLRTLYLKRARLVGFFVIMAAYCAILYLGAASFLPSQGNDAKTIANLSESVGEIDSFDGYAVMSFIYSITNEPIRYAILFIMSIAFFYYVLKWCRGIVSIGLAMFLCISPILLFLTFFVKDTFYLPFMLFALFAMTHIRRSMIAVGLSALGLVIYAFLFRQYFLLIAGVFIALTLFKYMSWPQRIVAILMVVFIAPLIPSDLYIEVQAQRDIINYYRIGFSGAGMRTAFMNYMSPSGLYSFLVNYGYAFLRLNFAVLFYSGPKELFMTVNTLLYGFLLWVALRSRDARVWRPAILFLAHFLTLILFESDLGSFMRHTGTSVPLLAPALGALYLPHRNPRRTARIAPPANSLPSLTSIKPVPQ